VVGRLGPTSHAPSGEVPEYSPLAGVEELQPFICPRTSLVPHGLDTNGTHPDDSGVAERALVVIEEGDEGVSRPGVRGRA
jgi:hypothetical protein